jgi:hypothetical protein
MFHVEHSVSAILYVHLFADTDVVLFSGFR